MAGGGIKVNYNTISGGADGITYVPSYNAQTGELEWTNNRGKPNPPSMRVKGADGQNGKDGKDGKDGARGPTGAKLLEMRLEGQDTNGGNVYLMTFDDGTTARFTAPRGEKGDGVDLGLAVVDGLICVEFEEG